MSSADEARFFVYWKDNEKHGFCSFVTEAGLLEYLNGSDLPKDIMRIRVIEGHERGFLIHPRKAELLPDEAATPVPPPAPPKAKPWTAAFGAFTTATMISGAQIYRIGPRRNELLRNFSSVESAAEAYVAWSQE